MNEQEFTALSQFARSEDYLANATNRERVWYERQKQLIHEKFGDEITPLRIEIFRRKNVVVVGTCETDSIRLHNKQGCNRNTLLHELTHAYLDYKWKKEGGKHYRFHTNEFWGLLKYLNHGGTTNGFYGREQKLKERVAACRKEKSSPDYKLKNIAEQLKAWETKLKRATTAIKKLMKKRKYYERKM